MEQLGKANAIPNAFNVLDRNRVLFEWNNGINKYPEGIIEEDMVLYPTLAAEISGVVLNQDQPIPLMKTKSNPKAVPRTLRQKCKH